MANYYILNHKTLADKAFRIIILKCIKQIEENTAHLNKVKDPEFLHQLRVGLRKLDVAMQLLARFCLDLIDNDKFMHFKQVIKQYHNQFSKARDWDVFINNILPQMVIKFPLVTAYQSIQKNAYKVTIQNYRQIIKITKTKQYKNLWLELKTWIDQDNYIGQNTLKNKPIIQISNRRLEEKHERLLQYSKSQICQLSEQQQHKLRIFIKKYHYTLNFFINLYPAKSINKYLSILNKLQNILGAMHDYVAMRGICAELSKHNTTADIEYDITLGEIIGFKACEVEAMQISLEKEWQKLCKFKPFWVD